MNGISLRRRLAFGSGAVGLLIGLFIGFLVLRPQSELTLELLLAYLTVFLSWPVIVLIIALVAIWRFHEPLSEWFKNMAFRVPGGFEFGQDRQQPPPDEKEAEVGSEDVVAAGRDLVAETETIDTETIQTRLVLEEQKSTYWYFMFLDTFFVLLTKRVLVWLAGKPPTHEDEYHSEWQWTIITHQDRLIVLNALTTYEVAKIDEGMISITDHGREFVRWARIANLAGPTPKPRVPPPRFIPPGVTLTGT